MDGQVAECNDERAKPMSSKKLQKVRERIRNALLSEKLGISNESNPWGDSTLAEPFIWKKKKIESGGASGSRGVVADPGEIIAQAEKTILEIEAVKKRREDRRAEQELLEEQKAHSARDREQEYFEELSRRDDRVEANCARDAAMNRRSQGRSNFVDLATEAADVSHGNDPVCPSSRGRPHPLVNYDVFSALARLTVSELETAFREIHPHRGPYATPTDRRFSEFWRSVEILIQDATKQAKKKISESHRKQSLEGRGHLARDEDTGIPLAVEEKIRLLLMNQTKRELRDMSRYVEAKLGSRDADLTYWESIQSKLPIFQARAEVKEVFEICQKRLSSKVTSTPSPSLQTLVADEMTEDLPICSLPPAVSYSSDEDEETRAPSPHLFPFSVLAEEEILTDPLDDLRERRMLREKILASVIANAKRRKLETSEADVSPQNKLRMVAKDTFEKFVMHEKKTMGSDEQILSEKNEIVLEKEYYDWEEKFRPRKPRYFTRVKTGFEWNKYNQTHYDHDNPPPKAVQGYKFNIFYPDLLDRTKAPLWVMEQSDTSGTVILRFKAGPPYEDVAFKIIDREWDLNVKRGFRNLFDKGIFQLYFNFKRYRYRR